MDGAHGLGTWRRWLGACCRSLHVDTRDLTLQEAVDVCLLAGFEPLLLALAPWWCRPRLAKPKRQKSIHDYAAGAADGSG